MVGGLKCCADGRGVGWALSTSLSAQSAPTKFVSTPSREAIPVKASNFVLQLFELIGLSFFPSARSDVPIVLCGAPFPVRSRKPGVWPACCRRLPSGGPWVVQHQACRGLMLEVRRAPPYRVQECGGMDERLKFWLRTAIKSAPGQRQLSNGPVYPPASLPARNTACRVPSSPQGRIRPLEGPTNLGEIPWLGLGRRRWGRRQRAKVGTGHKAVYLTYRPRRSESPLRVPNWVPFARRKRKRNTGTIQGMSAGSTSRYALD